MSYNRRSRLITQGVARSPNRAMLRAVGFGDDLHGRHLGAIGLDGEH